ncbi:MAG: serine hydrolase [Chloroflexia bacterium]|nr:serine hydrolase [Chloroflexia bacterium]
MTQRPVTAAPGNPGRRLNRRQALLQTGAGVVAGVATAAATTGRIAAQEATPESASAPPLTVQGEVTPERAAQAVERVREYATHLLEESGVPGLAVAVVYNDEVLLAEGFGVRELGKDEPIEADTVFQLASVSKSLAATVVSSVVGDGSITWRSRLADIAPGFALAEAWPTQNVTLTDLFSHRSGLPDHAGDLLEDLGYSQVDIFHRLRYLTPAYSFRAGYLYTNYGLTVAAEGVATATGVAWANLSRQRLYEPLGMDHTSSLFSDYMAQPNRAIPHIRVGDTWEVTPQQRDPDNQSPAGGVSSTVNDLAKWIRLLFGAGTYEGQELIPAAALTPVHTPQSFSTVVTDPANQRPGFYGLGSGVSYTDFGRPQWSHSGAFALGAGTAYYLLPASNFGIVALSNAMPIGVVEALCLDVLDVAQRGEATRDWFALTGPGLEAVLAPTYGTGTDWEAVPADASPAQPTSAYLGTFSNAYYGDVEVIESGDGLGFRIGPEPREFALTHYSHDTFSWQPTGENATVRSGLTFTIGVDGTADSFTDEDLADGGPGTLVKAAPVAE